VGEPGPLRDSAEDFRGTAGTLGLVGDIMGDKMSRDEGALLLRVLRRVPRLLRVVDLMTETLSKEGELELRVVELIRASAGFVYAGFLT